MLYLMMDQKKNYNLVKVGESRQLDNRRSNYKSHNPFAIMRSTCAGTESEERKCHTMLYTLGQRVTGTEWFIVSDEVFTMLYNYGMGYFFPEKKKIYFHEIFK